MNSLVLLLVGFVVLILAYATYGSWLAKEWGIDTTRVAPAHSMEDGIDYVPTKKQILIGHHFSSIAGAGPITGPVQAAVFGWLPVLLWILVGGIFFGGVHDYGSLFASMRHEGKSIGEVIQANMGRKGKLLFSLFAWLTLLLVVAAFTDIVATTFTKQPAAGIASMLFILLAVIFGFAVYRKGVPIGVATVVGLIVMAFCIWLGITLQDTIVLSKPVWLCIMVVYIAIASIAPVWILLQPRDYLNSYLLYTMIVGAFIGILMKRPEIQLSAVTTFAPAKYNYMFPMLFVTVACGAISGFHSLVSSGTTSKQIDNEGDAKFIGYGSMLIESFLAIISLISAAYLTKDDFAATLKDGGPINVFSSGCANFMNAFGLPISLGKTFVSLAISAFALTSLDTSTRLGRFILQEFFTPEGKTSEDSDNPLTNKYVATAITVALGGLLAFKGYQVVWPIFGSANQLLAALALMSVAVWLRREGKKHNMILIPMAVMFAVCLSALVLVMLSNMASGNYILIAFAVVLFILAIVLLLEALKIFSDKSTFGKKLERR